MNVNEVILKRRSIRKFSSEPIPQEVLIKILEAARWAPTAVNRQKTRFIVVTEENLLKEIADNSKIVFFRQRHAAQCSAMVIVCLDSSSWIEEVGAAIQNILLMGTELGIGTCWIGAFNKSVVRKLLQIPHSYKIYALILLGYYSEDPVPPPRLDLGKIAYLNKWRNPLTKSKVTILPKSGALSFITKRLIDTDSDLKKSPLYIPVTTIQTPARAGILGNPSDGFFGRTISIPIRNFHAEIKISESDRIEIVPGPSDQISFGSLEEMINDIKINGYYGGFRLIKAAVKQFYDFIKNEGISLSEKNFKIQYTSNIPRQVGLAGSSAIITSTMKALLKFYGVPFKKPILANYVLWAETKELGISAGLQDRVVQVYNEPVFMDFNENAMKKNGYGIYETMNADLFPSMYLAYKVDLTHKDIAHNDVRLRWERGDEIIRDTMIKIGDNAQDGYVALKEGNLEKFNEYINKNFDLRASIYPITEKNMQMIKLARSIGATAKFPGAGGAIIGTFNDEAIYAKLQIEFEKIGCKVVKIQLM